jgi:hypothetical protein
LKIGYIGSLKWHTFLQTAVLGCIFIYGKIKQIHNSLYVFDKWGKILSHKKMQYIYNTKIFTQRAKPILITSVRISGVLLLFVALGRWMQPSWTVVTGDEQVAATSSTRDS